MNTAYTPQQVDTQHQNELVDKLGALTHTEVEATKLYIENGINSIKRRVIAILLEADCNSLTFEEIDEHLEGESIDSEYGNKKISGLIGRNMDHPTAIFTRKSLGEPTSLYLSYNMKKYKDTRFCTWKQKAIQTISNVDLEEKTRDLLLLVLEHPFGMPVSHTSGRTIEIDDINEQLQDQDLRLYIRNGVAAMGTKEAIVIQRPIEDLSKLELDPLVEDTREAILQCIEDHRCVIEKAGVTKPRTSFKLILESLAFLQTDIDEERAITITELTECIKKIKRDTKLTSSHVGTILKSTGGNIVVKEILTRLNLELQYTPAPTRGKPAAYRLVKNS